MEYGKDIWMRYTLPTQHVLYFGIQAKKGKIDAAGQTKTGSSNVAEIHNQALMMLAHEISDPETNRRPRVYRGRRHDHQGSPQLARQRPGCEQTEPDHVHGSGRHPEPLRGDQPAAAGGGTPQGGQSVGEHFGRAAFLIGWSGVGYAGG
ncbi:hypothetical protein [Actinomadura sp. 9N215]|uniref:hypothetical protein n=1 Tax=Actinomadura sp. 9N215 TaxID=3375150 RepID=UPI0037A54015